MAEIKARLKIRQGAAGAWAALNPVLLQGELGYETDTKRLRVGDGVAAFTALPFITFDATSYQSASEKLTAINALTWAANKLIYTTGTNTAAVTDLSAFMRTILPAADLAALWTLLTADLGEAWGKLYLGDLASKDKISVPGDINAGGSAGSWSVLYGDGNWGPSPVAIANADPGMPRIVDAALSTTVTSAGQDWVAARMIAREHGGIGTLAFAARASGGTNAFGTTIAGSSLTPANAVGTTSGSTLTGTWRSLGWAASGGGEAGSTLWQRIA